MDTILSDTIWNEIISFHGEERADKCIEHSWNEFKSSRYSSAQILAEAALDLYQSSHECINSQKIINAYYAIAQSLSYKEAPKEAGDLLLTLSEYVRSSNESDYFEALDWAARSYFEANEFSAALDVLNKITEDLLLILEAQEYADVILRKAQCYYLLNQPNLAVTFFNEALEKLPNNYYDSKAVIHEDLADCYIDLKLSIQANHYAKLALDYALLINNRTRLTYSHWVTAGAKQLMGDLKLALSHYLRCKELLQSGTTPDADWLMEIDEKIAQIYHEFGKNSEAEAIEKRLASIQSCGAISK